MQAADAREEADGEALALAKIVAGLLGVSADEVFRRSERGFRSVKREGRRQANIIRLKGGIKFGMKAGFVVAVLAVIVLTSVWVYFDYQRRQQLAAIDAADREIRCDQQRRDIGTRGAVRALPRPLVRSATRLLLEPRYARALELLGAGKYQEAEHLLLVGGRGKSKAGSEAKATAAEAFVISRLLQRFRTTIKRVNTMRKQPHSIPIMSKACFGMDGFRPKQDR